MNDVPLTRHLRLTRPMMRGEDVLWLQTQLQTGGWPAAIGSLVRAIDGLFGPRTEAAVAALQRHCHLTVDGIAGPETFARLSLGPHLPPAAETQRAALTRRIAEVTAAIDPAGHLAAGPLAALRQPHARFSGGVAWQLVPHEGVRVAVGTVASGPAWDAAAARVLRDWFGPQIRANAAKYGIPVELIVATIATESAGSQRSRDQVATAERHEPGFRSHAETPHRVSIGCMQTLLSTARGTLGRPVAPEELRRPEVSIAAGTACIAQQAGRTLLDPPVVACAYNAGSVRPNLAPENRWRMVQYPIGTSAHADRFVGYFNAAYRLVQADPTLAVDAPCFARLL